MSNLPSSKTQGFQSTVAKRREVAPEADGQFDLSSLLGAMWRGKWIMVLVMFLVLFVGCYYAYIVAVPKYRSTAVVMLNNREEQVVDLESVVSGLGSDASVVNTEVQVLQSRSLLGKVVDDLDLTTDPEFNQALQDPDLKTRIEERLKALLPMLGDASAPALTPEEQRQQQHSQTVSALISALSVSNVAQSLVFNVTVETTSARKSARIADRLVELYIVDQIQVKFEATEQATSWLAQRVSELQGRLEKSEAELKIFSSSIELVSVEVLAGLERQLKDLRNRRNELVAQRDSNTAILQVLREETNPEALAEQVGDPRLRALANQPGQQEAFETARARIESRTEVALQGNNRQISTIETSLAEFEAQVESQSKDLIQLQQLTRETEANRMLYEYFLARLKETSAQQGIQQADSRILSPSVVPANAAVPRKSMIIVMSMILGFMLGTVIVLLRETRNKSVQSPRKIESLTGYRVQGVVPVFPKTDRKATIQYLVDKPTSTSAESIRNLRTSILLADVDNPPQVIMTTSSFPGEGKTTMALALAQNMSAMGKSVLLIEGDIRRRTLKTYVSSPERNGRGLTALITEDLHIEEVTIHDDLIGADIILGDKSSYNAADVFSSSKFSQFIARAREQYDQIIIDTPPVLLVPDARIIAQHVDHVLMVIRWNTTHEEQVVEALKMFESVERPVNGLILNQFNPKAGKGYGYGYGYRYGYAGKGAGYYTN